MDLRYRDVEGENKRWWKWICGCAGEWTELTEGEISITLESDTDGDGVNIDRTMNARGWYSKGRNVQYIENICTQQTITCQKTVYRQQNQPSTVAEANVCTTYEQFWFLRYTKICIIDFSFHIEHINHFMLVTNFDRDMKMYIINQCHMGCSRKSICVCDGWFVRMNEWVNLMPTGPPVRSGRCR